MGGPTITDSHLHQPEAMNGAYYLATLNCKETLLGDDLPAPLAGVTLGSAQFFTVGVGDVGDFLFFFFGGPGTPPKTNLGVETTNFFGAIIFGDVFSWET